MFFSHQCFFMLPPSCENLYLKECTQVRYMMLALEELGLDALFHSFSINYFKPPLSRTIFGFHWGLEITAGWKEKKISGSNPKIVLTSPKKFASYSTSICNLNFLKKASDRIPKSDCDIHQFWGNRTGLYLHTEQGSIIVKSFDRQEDQRADKKL